MTVERTLVVGFDDLKAVAFQCKNCGARISIQAKSLRDVPLSCGSCNARWRTVGAGQGMTAESAATGLIEAIVSLRVLIRENQDLFRVLLEFEEPKPTASA